MREIVTLLQTRDVMKLINRTIKKAVKKELKTFDEAYKLMLSMIGPNVVKVSECNSNHKHMLYLAIAPYLAKKRKTINIRIRCRD